MEAVDLAGRRILIVEDEFLLALELERRVRAAGGAVVGPVGSVERALARMHDGRLDGALLAVDLNEQPITPLAAALRERGVPFILVTDDGDTAPDEPARRGTPLMTRGTSTAELHRAMMRAFAGAP
jgi:DNA-binding LytR/AlgR family response regulator